MIRSFIYDTLILRLTAPWYAEVLNRVPEGSTLLDVGIGTAGALLANADLVKHKGFCVTGIDIDADYIERARGRLEGSVLKDCANARLESIYDHRGGPYDAVCFSGSFMVLPEPEKALRHCHLLLNADGRIYFTLTVQRQSAPWMEILKPMLKWVTSIDFGRVTYEKVFRAQLQSAGFEVEEFTALAPRENRAAHVVVARVRKTGEDAGGTGMKERSE